MKNNRTLLLSITGLLMALTALLGFTPLGFLHVGIFYATLLCIPVIVGTLLLGTVSGIIIGFTFGSISFYIGITAPSAMEAPILQANIIYAIILCYIPRLMIPLVTSLVSKALSGSRSFIKAIPIAAIAGSLTNTFLYLGMVLFFYIVIGYDHIGFLGTLGSIILFAGIPEAIVAAIVTTPIVLAIRNSKLLPNVKR
jgi:uncharacterized membrane protein